MDNTNKMTQIFSDPGNTSHEVIEETVDDPELNFQQAEARITSYNVCYTKLLRDAFRSIRPGHMAVPKHLKMHILTLFNAPCEIPRLLFLCQNFGHGFIGN